MKNRFFFKLTCKSFNFTQNFTFDKNGFGKKCVYWQKIYILTKNLNVDRKIQYWQIIYILPKKLNLDKKKSILTKNSILQKITMLTKNLNFDKNYNFDEKDKKFQFYTYYFDH